MMVFKQVPLQFIFVVWFFIFSHPHKLYAAENPQNQVSNTYDQRMAQPEKMPSPLSTIFSIFPSPNDESQQTESSPFSPHSPLNNQTEIPFTTNLCSFVSTENLAAYCGIRPSERVTPELLESTIHRLIEHTGAFEALTSQEKPYATMFLRQLLATSNRLYNYKIYLLQTYLNEYETLPQTPSEFIALCNQDPIYKSIYNETQRAEDFFAFISEFYCGKKPNQSITPKMIQRKRTHLFEELEKPTIQRTNEQTTKIKNFLTDHPEWLQKNIEQMQQAKNHFYDVTIQLLENFVTENNGRLPSCRTDFLKYCLMNNAYLKAEWQIAQQKSLWILENIFCRK
jgi:hypothetical protein